MVRSLVKPTIEKYSSWDDETRSKPALDTVLCKHEEKNPQTAVTNRDDLIGIFPLANFYDEHCSFE
jgi:hypothetical protein